MTSSAKKLLLFEQRPSLRDEWDYTKNIGIDPETLSSGTGKRVWWKCASGHEWQVRASIRADGRGCRECNTLEKARANSVASQPEIADQLDDPNYVASDLNRSSTKKVWWKCEKGHRWQAAPSSRCYGTASGCPYCSGYYPIPGETDLATLRPDLASQWDDDSVSPTEVTVANMRKVRWKCEKGHQFVTSIHSRSTSRTQGSGCPYCSKGRHAKVLAGVNDLATLHPEIAAELYSTHVTAQELREFTNKKFEWKCAKDHIWTAAVSNRTAYGSGCPQCATVRTSKIEGRLRSLVDSQEYLSGTVLDSNHKLPVPFRKRKHMSVDIYCEWRGLPVVIEYDGSFWHDREVTLSRDIDKTNALLDHDYLVVRIRENALPWLEIDHPNLLQLNVTYSRDEDTHLEEAVTEIEEWLNSRK